MDIYFLASKNPKSHIYFKIHENLIIKFLETIKKPRKKYCIKDKQKEFTSL